MIKALEVLAPTPYAPAGGDGDEPVRFILRPLSGMEWLEVEYHLPGNGRWNGAATKAALKCGLVGWENFADSAGPVPFLADKDANIARLSAALILELRREIESRTVLAIEDKKK